MLLEAWWPSCVEAVTTLLTPRPANIRSLAEATELGDVIESTVSELPVSWKWGVLRRPCPLAASPSGSGLESAPVANAVYLHTKLGEGDVTLLGDAAHAQLPALGLGVSTALGDIEELIAQVKKHGLSRRALRRYERSRMPTCAALQLMSRATWRLNSVASNR